MPLCLIAGTASVSLNETSQHLEEDVASKPAAQEENSATPLMCETSGHGVTETSRLVATVELQNSATDSGDMSIIKTSDQRTGSDMDPTPQLHSSPESSKKDTPQAGRGRLSKVKPKPNLGQASRTAQSKSQPEPSTVRTAENHTVAPDLSQATETLSAAKIADCSQKLLKDEISCIEVKLTEEPTGSQERSVGLGTSDTAVTELQIGQGTNGDSAPVQQSSHHPVPCVTPVEDLPVSQKEESEDASTRQTRKSRFQKVKPKPNLAQTSRTAHSKPQTTKDTVEKDSNPTPNPKFHKKTIVEVEAEPTCTTSSDKPSQSTDPASDSVPPLDIGSTLTPTEELSTTVEKKTDVGVVGQVESGPATSDQSVSENQHFSEAQFEPSREQATRDTRPTHEKLISCVGTTESNNNNNLLTSDSAVPESQVGQGSNIDSAPIQESSHHPAPCDIAVEELPVSQKEESEDASTCQTRRGRLQKVKPKPNLAQTSRTVRSKPQTKKDPVTHMQPIEKPSSPTSRPESTDNTIAEVEAQPPTCSTTPPEKPSQIKSTGTATVSEPSLELCSTHKPTEELSSTAEQKTDVGSALDSNSEGSEQNVPQRRRRFPKVKPKPNLGSSTRTTQTKQQSNDISKPSEQCHMDTSLNVTSEQQPVDCSKAQTELKLAEKESKHLTSTHCSLHTELLSSTKLRPAESEKPLDSTNDMDTSSDGTIITTSWVAETQSVLTDSVLENESSEKPTVEGESAGDKMPNDDKLEAGPAKTQPTEDPTAISDVQSSEDGSTESKIKSILSTNTQSTPDPKESTQQPHSENDSEAQSQDAVQQCPETNQTAARR